MPKCSKGCLSFVCSWIFCSLKVSISRHWGPSWIWIQVDSKYFCLSWREVSERINKLNRENTDLGILVVFLMFSAAETFQDLLIFFFFISPSHSRARSHFLFAIMNRPAPVEISYEDMRFDNPQPYQCYPQQVHRGKIVAWCTFWYIIYLWFIGRIR